MKNVLLMATLLIFGIVSSSSASEKGSMMDKGSMMEEKVMDKDSEDGSAGQMIAEIMEGSAATAVSEILGTAEGSTINGVANIHEIEDGAVHVMVFFSGAPPGKHGIHIHENGDCSDGGKAAGGHYNPKGVSHGYLPEAGFEGAHAGDLGNIIIDEEGKGSIVVKIEGLSIHGEYGVDGLSFILHEKEDDFGQPTGNAGSRIACGLIIAEKK